MAEEMWGVDCQGKFGAPCPGRKERDESAKANDKCTESAPSCCHCLDWKAEKGRKLPKVVKAIQWPPIAQGTHRPKATKRTQCDLPLQPSSEALPHLLSAPDSWTFLVSWLCSPPACCQPFLCLFLLSSPLSLINSCSCLPSRPCP